MFGKNDKKLLENDKKGNVAKKKLRERLVRSRSLFICSSQLSQTLTSALSELMKCGGDEIWGEGSLLE